MAREHTGGLRGDGFWTDGSWRAACRDEPLLAEVARHLPPVAPPFEGRDLLHGLHSSYRQHQYELLFYGLVRALRPATCVEIGVLEGFSLFATAAALRDNAYGHVTGYDLFDRYPYRHSTLDRVAAGCRMAQLQAFVTLQQADADDVCRRHASVDLLHVDISNDGDTFHRQFSRWAGKVTRAIVLEGGASERDDVAWMKTYARPGIAAAVEDLSRSHPEWRFCVIAPFPSVTVAVHRK